jgi:hypothetical protein
MTNKPPKNPRPYKVTPRGQIVKIMQYRGKCSEEQASGCLDGLIEMITASLACGDPVNIKGFGTFSPCRTGGAGKRGRIGFRSSPDLRDVVFKPVVQ